MIPFNKPHMTGKELFYISQAHSKGALAGDGIFTKRCHSFLETYTRANKVLLTHSCTAALEMAAMLAGIGEGDEVIMPSYTFVSTANAFVLRGATPVFIDIRPDTLNLDETKIEAAITNKTKAIVPVHYAGVSCEMDAIMEIADRYDLIVIEDAAQGVSARYKDKSLGAIGHLAAYSFHETKNVISGEGGALLINDNRFVNRAEIIREKGTNRSQFFRGHVDKYTWVDLGSSYLPGELVAAFLWGQLEAADEINIKRLKIWEKYHQAFNLLEHDSLLRRPIIPKECQHNAHMYYLLLNDIEARDALIEHLKKSEIHSVFHYVPLHSSPAGRKYGRAFGSLENTVELSNRLLRLPMFYDLNDKEQEFVIKSIIKFFNEYK